MKDLQWISPLSTLRKEYAPLRSFDLQAFRTGSHHGNHIWLWSQDHGRLAAQASNDLLCLV